MNFLLKYWKIIVVVVLVAVVLLWVNSYTQTASKLWEMVFADVKQDQEWIEKDLVSEINRLDGEREALLKKIALLQSDKQKLISKNAELDSQKCELEAKLSGIVVPNTMADIISGFHEMGLGSARARDLPK